MSKFFQKLNVTLAIISGILIPSIQAQTIAPPSPNSRSLAQEISVPVNLYNGSASVSVPLMSAPGAPVALNYNASGIRVQDIASQVGLGWSLRAGGSIIRMVRHVPDESEEFLTSTSNSEMDAFFSSNRDTEKDIFYISLPTVQGRFIFTDDLRDYAYEYITCDSEQLQTYLECIDICGQEYSEEEEPEYYQACTTNCGSAGSSSNTRVGCYGEVVIYMQREQ